MLIDFHTHLLPAIDDGSQSVAESLDMLEASRLQNVRCIVATPHFYADRTNLADFLHQRDKAYELLLSQHTQSEPKVLLGAEVTYFRGIGKAEGLENLCIAGTNALLLEMPFTQWGKNELNAPHRILNRGLIPIIAHIERYYPFQRDLTVFNEVLSQPVYLQVNAEALLSRRTRRFVFKLIENGYKILLGTDCHNMNKRKPDIEAGRQIIMRAFGKEYLDAMDALGEELLKPALGGC